DALLTAVCSGVTKECTPPSVVHERLFPVRFFFFLRTLSALRARSSYLKRQPRTEYIDIHQVRRFCFVLFTCVVFIHGGRR
ncbi:unnamed protein product, partial [Amoebophrya sp. A120]